MKTEHTPATVSKHYISQLFREVPRTNIRISSPLFDKKMCWHCQENERIQTKFNVLVWCLRCYKLQAKKGDGTYAQQTTIPILQDLVDVQQGKVKIIPEIQTERKIIQE